MLRGGTWITEYVAADAAEPVAPPVEPLSSEEAVAAK